MDKNVLKKYAVWARRELIVRVGQRATFYGVTEEDYGDVSAESINGRILSDIEKRQRKALIAQIRKKGYEEVIEEVAYTWFNRFLALRFMEVNGYLPDRVKIFTDSDNRFQPQILNEAIDLEIVGLDMEKVYAYKDANQTEELYKYLLVVQCNALNAVLPGMFQKIEDYTELLLPDKLLLEGSVIERMIALIPEEDWKDAVQIIGWMYQYYNSEKKDEVFAALKKNVKITKENIPAATQLFTPDWIVRYMVENSLGRLWLEGHPNEELKAKKLREAWIYYLEEAQQEPEVEAELAKIRAEYAQLTPEDIRCIDPCQGSGHILVYMFDVLMQIYESYGYTTQEAVASIVKNNIYGLDIDERAAQLSYFAVMMKACQYDKRFLKRKDEDGNPKVPQPRVYAIQESNDVDSHVLEYFCNGNAELEEAMESIMEEMHDAKEYGSIITVTEQNWDVIYARFEEIKEDISIYKEGTLELLPLVQVAQSLAQKYDVVVTNPPYMGASNMNPRLNEFIKQNYADYKSDFFSAFVIHCSEMTKESGYCGFFTPYVWMFIQSYEKMRNYLYTQATIEILIQFEYSAFEEATVPVCTFAFQNRYVNKKGCYLRLVDFRGGMEVQRQKTLEAIGNHSCGFYYEQSTDNFSKIPGSPVAYWMSWNFLEYFAQKKIRDYGVIARIGLVPGNNDYYLKKWYEIHYAGIGFNCSREEALKSAKKWFPYNKAGDYRKWYGNLEYVVNWANDGHEMQTKLSPDGKRIWAHNFNLDYIFKAHIGWNDITSSTVSYRYYEKGFLFDSASNAAFCVTLKQTLQLIGYLNSKIVKSVSPVLNPTLHFKPGDMLSLSYISPDNERIVDVVDSCIKLSKLDWDSFETSWDFQRHPLLQYAAFTPQMVVKEEANGYLTMNGIADAYRHWEQACDERFNQLKANEEELNRIFIDIYGLQEELTPEVEDKDVTVRKADLGRDIRSFISYAVGCMFGRYSLDVDGLAYAGGEWDNSKYASFPADKDNIIPICDDEYFEDDIAGLFVEFVKTVYGAETLDENLKFIADALGGKGQPKDVIRNYFLNDFYANHCKIYQKRPIYWLFDSGKKNGFKALIYMHRYQPDTIARIRTDYVHEQQARYRTAIADLEQRIANASTGERVKLNKKLTVLQAQATEIRTYEEKIHHLADQMISIDLDDGVKKNYAMFQDVLAKIK